MKILVVSLPDLQRIPIQRYHYLVKALAKEHDVTVLSVNAWWLEEREDSKAMLENIRYRYITKKRIHPIFQELLVFKYIPKIKEERYDVIINFNTLLAGLGLKICLRNIPMLFDIADELVSGVLNSPNFPKLLKNRISRNAIIKLVNINLLVADIVTMISKGLKEKYNIPNAKIVPNGVEISKYATISLKKTNREIKKLKIGFIGVLREWVDFKNLFEAISSLKLEGIPVSVTIIGDGPQKPVALAKKLNITENVHFVGFVTHDKIPLYLQKVDIGVIPFNDTEIAMYSFPIKALEYLASRKVVVSSYIPALKSYFCKAMFFATNTQEYAQILKDLFFNPKITRKKGSLGYTIVSRAYTWDIIGEKFSKIVTGRVKE